MYFTQKTLVVNSELSHKALMYTEGVTIAHFPGFCPEINYSSDACDDF